MFLTEVVVDERGAIGTNVLMEERRHALTLRNSVGDILLEIEKRYLESRGDRELANAGDGRFCLRAKRHEHHAPAKLGTERPHCLGKVTRVIVLGKPNDGTSCLICPRPLAAAQLG